MNLFDVIFLKMLPNIILPVHNIFEYILNFYVMKTTVIFLYRVPLKLKGLLKKTSVVSTFIQILYTVMQRNILHIFF